MDAYVNDVAMDGIGLLESAVEDTLTTGRKSARSQRIEVITRGERRRRWTVEQKQEIVAASLRPGVRAADVAREHGINTGLLYTWRRQLLEGQLGAAAQPLASFARVEVATGAELRGAAGPSAVNERGRVGSIAMLPETSVGGGLIEIALLTGVRVRVDKAVDGRALRRVLSTLEGR